MSLQQVNIGAAPNDSSGDPLRTAFSKVNANSVQVDTYMSAVITTRSPDGVVKAYRPASDSVSLRSALLVTAVQQAQSGDVITLTSGAFTINASLTPLLAGGVTGVTIAFGPGATYHYTDNEHSVADYAMFPQPQPVGTLAELQSAISGVVASTKERRIKLVRDIDVSGPVDIPRTKTLTPAGFLMRQGGGGSVTFRGFLDSPPMQVFSGFAEGEVLGNFRSEYTYPEWWGLVPDNHDIAINLAIQSSTLDSGQGFGCKVKLSPGIYAVSHEIDLSGKSATLEGSGQALTIIRATSAWTDRQWLKCIQWGSSADFTPNHGAMIWIGSKVLDGGAILSYNSKIKHLSVECINASYAHWNDGKRVSGISCRGSIEEGCDIHDVNVSFFTGFGIGSDRHANPATSTYALSAIMNGLEISQCSISGPTKRDARPVFFSGWANNCQFRLSTVNMTLHKFLTPLHNTSGAAGGNNPAVNPTPPEQFHDFTAYAITAKGHVTISDIHIEGSLLGVFVMQGESSDCVTLNNIKCWALSDKSRNPAYTLDGKSGAIVSPPFPDVWNHGAAVVVAGINDTSNFNPSSVLTVNNVSTPGQCPFLLRDVAFNVHLSMFNQGQFPDGQSGGKLAFYARGSAYLPPAVFGVPPSLGAYNPASPATDRTYVIGPVY